MLPEEITKFIGVAEELGTYEVDKGGIRRFANAAEDFNPLYWDEAYANASRYGSLIAPPGYFGWPTKPVGAHIVRSHTTEQLDTALREAGYTRGVGGGSEFDFFRPIRVGETLQASQTTTNIIEKHGRSGPLIFVTKEITYTDQQGDVVAKVRMTSIRR